MAKEINLTDGIVRVLTAAGVQSQLMTLAVDVSSDDQADLVLHVVGVEGAVTTFVLAIITGMTLESEDSWVEVGTFSSNTTPNFSEKKNFPGLLKYARWKVKTITGGTAVAFSVRGMLRQN